MFHLEKLKCTTNKCTITSLLETLQVLLIQFLREICSAKRIFQKTPILFNHDFGEPSFHIADGSKLPWLSQRFEGVPLRDSVV